MGGPVTCDVCNELPEEELVESDGLYLCGPCKRREDHHRDAHPEMYE